MTGDWVSLIDSFFVCMGWGWGFGKPLKEVKVLVIFPQKAMLMRMVFSVTLLMALSTALLFNQCFWS
jgi:hypothetical protein